MALTLNLIGVGPIHLDDDETRRLAFSADWMGMSLTEYVKFAILEGMEKWEANQDQAEQYELSLFDDGNSQTNS